MYVCMYAFLASRMANPEGFTWQVSSRHTRLQVIPATRFGPEDQIRREDAPCVRNTPTHDRVLGISR